MFSFSKISIILMVFGVFLIPRCNWLGWETIPERKIRFWIYNGEEDMVRGDGFDVLVCGL